MANSVVTTAFPVILAAVAEYSETVVANTRLFAERAREIVEQEIDRAKSLDTKAGAVIAASVALAGASVAFVLRFADLDAGSGAKTLWAVEIGAALLALLVAGGLAVWALAPMVVRSQIAFHELQKWVTLPTLEQEPTLNEGTILNARLHSIGVSRTANKKKSDRLRLSSFALGAALAAIVALAISVAINSAIAADGGVNEEYGRSTGTTRESGGRPRESGAGRANLPDAGPRHGTAGGSGGGGGQR
jgi:hypothetical protein